VSEKERIRRKRAFREAEGYLDLATVFEDRWPLSPAVRNRLAERTLEVLGALGDSADHSSRALFLRGQALLLMEQFQEATVPLKAATEIEPENVHTWLALGWCYKRLGRLDLAIQSLEEALAVEPDLAIVHYNLACYWSLAKNSKLAVNYLANAFDLDPHYRDKVSREPDFDNIRSHPHFLALTTVIV
jgi:tetratricopeptide (TPR) repeat protein